MEGIRSIANEAWKLCVDNDEEKKYLMTFQNLLSRIVKWNSVIIEEERKRIIERSGCNYLEELITCVHIIQLKVLTCIRVGNKQKKIDISIPKLDNFIHKVYIHVARKVYMNIYLFEHVNSLQKQKNNRELEQIIQECILMTIRESIPTEAIIRAYMDESVEHEETVLIENVDDIEIPKNTENDETIIETAEESNTMDSPELPVVPSIKNIDDKPVVTQLTFHDANDISIEKDVPELISKRDDLESFDKLSSANALQKRIEDDKIFEEERLKIHTDDIIDLDDIDDLINKKPYIEEDILLDDIEEL